MKRPCKPTRRRLKTARKASRAPGRPGISSLGEPNARFDLTKTPGFELQKSVEDEDRRRARMLRRAAKADPAKAAAFNAMADRIDPDVTCRPDSLASSRHMRTQRIRVIGALWELIHGA